MGAKGANAVVRRFCWRNRISIITAVVVSPQRRHLALYFQLQGRNIKARNVADFLRHLLGHLRRQVVLLWDEALIHKGRAVKELLGRRRRLHIERFLKYAPEPNPVEFVWTQTKRRMPDSCLQSARELKKMVDESIGHIRSSQTLLKSCLLASELSWP